MTPTAMRKQIPVLGVGFVAGIAGLACVLATMGEMDDWLRLAPVYGAVSAATWTVLARFIQGRSIWVSAAVGLVSPLLACLATAPLLVGVMWAIVLLKIWYLALLVGVGTGVAMHFVLNGRARG